MTRISRDEWGLRLAEVVALRATCLRRSVGCVLTDKHGFVLSTGYNGRAIGLPHCNHPIIIEGPQMPSGIWVQDVETFPYTCPGAHAASGTNLDGCEAIHAECNSLLQCREVQAIRNCYVTVSPCVSCVKLLLNTSCERIVFRAAYANENGEAARRLWGRDWKELKGGDDT